jgi:hypothetical protein
VLQIQSGDDLGTAPQRGFNNFSVAACSGCQPNQPTFDPNVSISAITKMALFANTSTANPHFYLARVPTWARGQVLTMSFFDVGDIFDRNGNPLAGSLTVAAVDATHGTNGGLVGEFGNCTFSHPDSRGTDVGDYISGQPTPWDPGASDLSWARNPSALTGLSGCTAPVSVNPSRSNWNGKWVTWKVPIPADYTCNDLDQAKCWLQVRYAYANADFHDETTWTASLSGNPVRLTK